MLRGITTFFASGPKQVRKQFSYLYFFLVLLVQSACRRLNLDVIKGGHPKEGTP